MIEDGAYTVDGEYVPEYNPYDPRTDTQYEDEWQDDYSDGVDLHEFDNDLPIIEIIQPQTQGIEPKFQGQFIRKDTGEIFETMEIVPLAIKANRTQWPPKFNRSDRPHCFSSNGITTNITLNEHLENGCENEACREEAKAAGDMLMTCNSGCPHFTNSPWTDKRLHGFCSPGYTLIALWEGEPVIMRMSGTNAKHAKMMGNRRNIRQRVMSVHTREETGDDGRWYVFMIAPVREADKRLVSGLWFEQRERFPPRTHSRHRTGRTHRAR